MTTNIDSLSQALQLLQVVADHPNTGLSELARISGLNKSRAYRMLCTLAAHNFVIQNENSTYQLGYQLLTLGHIAKSQSSWLTVAESVLEPLVNEFNENLQIRIRENLEIVQVWRRVSSQPLQVRSEAGNRRPLGAGAAGKVLLAFATEDIQRAFFSTQTAAQTSDLQEKIALTKQQGFYISKGDLTEGVCAIAIPLRDMHGECIACLSLSAPISRMPEERIQYMLSRLKEVAREFFIRLGGQTP
ncbi:MAG: IclR family transcriptional regulator [Pelistega sp.]|nr:IclR family transcriptional regulator [Pelistega sp.]